MGAGWKLWTQQGAEFSLSGLVISVLAIPIMYFLSRRKLQVAKALGSRALRADAIESITCGWLAFVVVGAVVAQFFIDAFAEVAANKGAAGVDHVSVEHFAKDKDQICNA